MTVLPGLASAAFAAPSESVHRALEQGREARHGLDAAFEALFGIIALDAVEIAHRPGLRHRRRMGGNRIHVVERRLHADLVGGLRHIRKLLDYRDRRVVGDKARRDMRVARELAQRSGGFVLREIARFQKISFEAQGCKRRAQTGISVCIAMDSARAWRRTARAGRPATSIPRSSCLADRARPNSTPAATACRTNSPTRAAEAGVRANP